MKSCGNIILGVTGAWVIITVGTVLADAAIKLMPIVGVIIVGGAAYILASKYLKKLKDNELLDKIEEVLNKGKEWIIDKFNSI